MMQKFLLVLLTLLLTAFPIFGQSFPNQRYCSAPDVSPPTLPINETCTTYTNCLSDDIGDSTCYYAAFLSLLDICQANNRSTCVELSAMYMGQFTAIVGAYDDLMDTTFHLVWAFDANGLEAALNYYDSFEYANAGIEMMHGIVLDAQGDTENAILAFTQSIMMDSKNPIVYYLRGQSYLEVDDLERASYDFYSYRSLAPDDLLAELPVPEPIFVMPDDAETWMIYPVIQRNMGPGGVFVSDLTLSPPTETQIVISETGETVAITDLTTDIGIAFFMQDELDDTSYSYGIALQNINTAFMYDDGYTRSFTLSSLDPYWELSSLLVGFESGSQSKGILAPLDVPDPRLSLERPCESLPISWIKVGDVLEAVNDMRMSPITIYSQPQIDDDMFEDSMGFAEWWRDNDFAEIIATDGPVCGDENLWWEVTIADQIAWIPDNQQLLPDSIIRTVYNGVLPSVAEILAMSTSEN